jgi:uncharacterized membrane protein
MSGTPGRSLHLDAIRGVLVILMVVYHAAYISVMAGLAHIDLYQGFWWIFPRTIAAGFIAVSGWSLAGKKARGGSLKAFALRAGWLAVPALAITAISAVMFRTGFVFFGILHLLAVASILAWPFLGRPLFSLAAGLAVFASGLALGNLRFDWPYLAWLGLRPAGLYPVDYLPLLPWLAWCLFGAAAKDLALRQGLGNTGRPDIPGSRSDSIAGGRSDSDAGWPSLTSTLKPLAFAGRYSLTIYLTHLPALYGLASLLSLLTRN